MDTDKWKSVLVPIEVYKEIKALSQTEGRTISGQLRIIFEAYKREQENAWLIPYTSIFRSYLIKDLIAPWSLLWGVFMSNQDDYLIALKETNKFIDDMMDTDLDAGAAYTGIITAAVFRLLKGCTDKQDATGIIGAAMASASAHVEMEEGILSDIH